ncbi:MAG TPA: hypothetical protein VFU88_03475 [Ktedonobacterales bacterium]|nr:hypothetical protein [Ktedonobacterales bacterium]
MNHRRNARMPWLRATTNERRVRTSIFLPRLTVADGEWLAQVLPALQRNARPEPQAVRVEDVSLRYRSGRLGIADALDAAAVLLSPFAAAGASLEHRNEWYIADDDEDDEELFDTDKPATLDEAPGQDLLVSARVVVDAAGEDAGAAALYWAVVALASS